MHKVNRPLENGTHLPGPAGASGAGLITLRCSPLHRNRDWYERAIEYPETFVFEIEALRGRVLAEVVHRMATLMAPTCTPFTSQ